jgi:hypothetical protein
VRTKKEPGGLLRRPGLEGEFQKNQHASYDAPAFELQPLELLQAANLARRFNLAPHLATIIAPHAFANGRRA